MPFKIPRLCATKKKFDLSGLKTFSWDQVLFEELIGEGGFGKVRSAVFGGEKVVIKQALEDGYEKHFVKECRLMNLFNHQNVIGFKGICMQPLSIMMEIAFFDFGPLGYDKKVYNLRHWLMTVDDMDSKSIYELTDLFPVIGKNIASGLDYLHSLNVAHRDLKPENILVSNRQYCELDPSTEDFLVTFQSHPIICKLTDFGESRSDIIQTNALLKPATHHVMRGSIPYMAPEILLDHLSLGGASLEDLKRVDLWAFGMTIYMLMNPGVKHPYQLDTSEQSQVGFQRYLCDAFTKQGRPSPSPRYGSIQQCRWKALLKIFEQCTCFNPNERPSLQDLLNVFPEATNDLEKSQDSSSKSEQAPGPSFTHSNPVDHLIEPCQTESNPPNHGQLASPQAQFTPLKESKLGPTRNEPFPTAADHPNPPPWLDSKFPSLASKAKGNKRKRNEPSPTATDPYPPLWPDGQLPSLASNTNGDKRKRNSTEALQHNASYYRVASETESEIEGDPNRNGNSSVIEDGQSGDDYVESLLVAWEYVVMGDFHQASEDIFFEGAAGSQCLSMAIMAIVAALRTTPSEWTKHDIHSILQQGNDAHHDALRKLGWPNQRHENALDIDEISKVQEYTCGDGQVLKATLGMLDDGVFGFKLCDVLTKAFTDHPDCSFAFKLRDKCTAIIKGSDGRWGLFDSHSCNVKGEQSPDGAACVIIFRTTEQIIRHLRKLHPHDGHQIDIFPVYSQIVEDIEELSGEKEAPLNIRSPSPSVVEQGSFNSSEDVELPYQTPLFLRGDKDLPVFRSGKVDRFTHQEAVEILTRQAKTTGVTSCSKVPLRVRSNSAFLIDLDKLGTPDDVKADMNGTYPMMLRVATWTLKVNQDTTIAVLQKKKIDISEKSGNVYHLSVNSKKNNAGLCRSIFILYSKEGDIVGNCCLLQYHVDKGLGLSEVQFDVAPHGNRKHGNRPFFAMQKSTISVLKGKLSDGADAGDVYQKVTRKNGGIMRAVHPGQLPRSKQQCYDIKHKLKPKHENADLSLYSNAKEHSIILDHFSEPSDVWIMGTKQMSSELYRFCCSNAESHPFSVDPTFGFGKFEVTPFTYRNLLLNNKRSGTAPIFLGPTAIHQDKSTDTYDRIITSVVRSCPHGMKESVKGYITDGEVALYKALNRTFPNAVGLRCIRHFRQNCERKLTKVGIRSKKDQSFFLEMVFGKNLEGGLVDCKNAEELDAAMEAARVKLNEREAEMLGKGAGKGKFMLYLEKHRSDIADHMLMDKRALAGMPSNPRGRPRRPTTNQSESMNNVLTRQMEAYTKAEKKHSKLTKVEFVQNVWEPVRESQENEMKKAICGSSQVYELSMRAEYLQVPEDVWYDWSLEQRESYIEQVNSLSMADLKKRKTVSVKSTENQQQHADHEQKKEFSTDIMSILHVLDISNDVVRALIGEADRLLNIEGAVVRKPSLDVGRPSAKYHVATNDKKRGFVVCSAYSDHVNCDCNSFKLQGLCKHSLCVAEICSVLKKHLEWTVKKRRQSRALHQLPKEAAGKKGGRHRNAWRPRQNDSTESASRSQNDDILAQRLFTEVHHNNHKLVVCFLTDEPKALECKQCGLEFPRTVIGRPFDIVLSHKERWMYFNENDNARKRSGKFTTKYYCIQPTCILARFPYFTATDYLDVPDEIKERLHPSHLKILEEQLGYIQ